MSLNRRLFIGFIAGPVIAYLLVWALISMGWMH
jgi:cellobiose-specific phosphotransferase system component IIC